MIESNSKDVISQKNILFRTRDLELSLEEIKKVFD